jgi:soluble P-type ATPase
MFEVEVPGRGRLRLDHLVLDYNGTIARDGSLLAEAAGLIRTLAETLTVHVLTADTGGRCRENLSDLPVTIHVLTERPEDEAKLAYLRALGPDRCAAVGNGRNDGLMLKEAALGIAVIGDEGASPAAINAADVVVPGIVQALELFIHPLRLVATIRN